MRRFVFGPVSSRRLGRSLGIDLLPFKTCSLDCLYCECGWTTDKTLRRGELVPTGAVLAEIDAVLAADPEIDHVTFSGAGEPTLHSGLGQVIGHIKARYPRYKVAVLTNGTLLGEGPVQQALAAADVVVPSLDGATEPVFRRICRPAEGVTARAVIDGIAAFRRQFPGVLLLEIFLAPGINDGAEELAALKRAALSIAPDAVQLNSLDRPSPARGLTAPTPEALERIRAFLAPLPVQVVRHRGAGEPAPWSDPRVAEAIVALLGQGPMGRWRLSMAVGIREADMAKILARLQDDGRILVDDGGQARLCG